MKGLGNQQLKSKGPGTLGNSGRKTIRECGWESFNLVEGISSLGKNDKGKSSQKVGLKMWNLEVLKEERPKVSPLEHPKNKKVSRDF